MTGNSSITTGARTITVDGRSAGVQRGVRGVRGPDRRVRIAAVVLAAALVAGTAACSSDADPAAQDAPTTASTSTTLPYAEEPLDITATTPPPALDQEVTFVGDLRCGDAERNLIDVAVPPGVGRAEAGEAGTVPLVIWLHGGGFIGGDKESVWDADEVAPMNALLDRGVAVASMSYSLLGDPDPDGVMKPLMDAARCLQFMRHHGPATFGIDPERIALRGGSAGAGTALWLAVHDDLADPDAEDPILRRSTKPVAVAAHETQATYDLMRWSTDVFGEYDEMFGGRNLVELAELFGMSQRLLSFYGITDAGLLETPEISGYRADVDLLALMDPEDPPAWIANTREEDAVPVSVGLLFHHADHALALQRQATAVGYDATVTAGPGLVPAVDEIDYLLAALDHDGE